MESRTVGHSFKRRPYKDHPSQIWLIWLSDVKVYDVRWTNRRRMSTEGGHQ